MARDVTSGPQRRVLVLLALAMALAALAAFASRSRDGSPPPMTLRALAEGDAASASATVTCPAGADGSELSNVTRPVLTTSCPTACTAASLCVFFPSAFVGECGASTAPAARACLRGDKYGFECIPTPDSYMQSCYISLFTNATPAQDIRAWGAALPHFTHNASRVAAWVGDADRAKVLTDISIADNEEAKNLSYRLEGYTTANKYVPRGEVVPFELPSTFFANHQNLITIRLENVKYPPPPQEGTANFTFRSLLSLYAAGPLRTEWRAFVSWATCCGCLSSRFFATHC